MAKKSRKTKAIASKRAQPLPLRAPLPAVDPARWPANRIEQRALGQLVPYARNARTHSPEQVAQIAASIAKFGWTMPALVDETGMLLAGHGRVLAAAKLGLAEVPVMVALGWSEADKRSYILADNQLALNAGWDKALLSAELTALAALPDVDLLLLGFSEQALAELIEFPERAGRVDADSAPQAPPAASTVSRPGDLWLLGEHRLLCGDCTVPAAVAALLAGETPVLMVTDPPYGVEYDPAWRNAVGVGARAVGKVQNDARADWREAWMLFPGAVAYVWHGGLHAGTVDASLRAAGFGLRAQIVWVKTRPVISRGHYHWQHEPALYAVRGDSDDQWQGDAAAAAVERFEAEHAIATYAVKDGATARWRGGRKQSTVWMIEHIKSETGHGTQKPVECMRRPMLNNSRAGDLVYEPFSGSGTTIIAGEMTGRRVRAIEIDPAYVDVAVRRWEGFTGQRACLAAGGLWEEVARERGVALSAAA